MATRASSTSTGVGSLNEPVIVAVLETKRNPNAWCNFNMVKLSDGNTKPHSKHCYKFLKSESNSMLKGHIDNYCEALKSNPEARQASMS